MADTTGEAAVPAAVPPALETSAEMTPEPQARGCSGTGIPGVTVVKKNQVKRHKDTVDRSRNARQSAPSPEIVSRR